MDGPTSSWRFPGHATDIFHVDHDNIIIILLTYSSSRNLLEESFMPATNKASKEQLIQYLKSHTVDYVVIRGNNGPKHVPFLQNALNIGSQEYLPNTNLDWMSLQKCRSLDEPYNLYHFKLGNKTPG